MSAFALNTQLIASLFFNMLKRYCYCRGWLYLFRKLFVLRSFRSPMRVWIPKELFSPLKNRPLFQKAKFHPQWFLCDPFGVQKCIWKCELEMAYAVCLWKSADSKWIETEVLVCCSEPPDGTWNGRDRRTTLVDPFFPHLSLPPSVPAPLPLPAPGGVSAPLRQGWGAAGTFQNWLGQPRPVLTETRAFSPAGALCVRKRSQISLLHYPPQLWLEWSLRNFWFWPCEWCSVGRSSTLSGAAQAQHTHFATAACRIRACSR